MNIKLALYCLIIPISMWIVTSINLDKLFRKGKTLQIHFFYVFISLGLSYLLVNFFTDLYNTICYL